MTTQSTRNGQWSEAPSRKSSWTLLTPIEQVIIIQQIAQLRLQAHSTSNVAGFSRLLYNLVQRTQKKEKKKTRSGLQKCTSSFTYHKTDK